MSVSFQAPAKTTIALLYLQAWAKTLYNYSLTISQLRLIGRTAGWDAADNDIITAELMNAAKKILIQNTEKLRLQCCDECENKQPQVVSRTEAVRQFNEWMENEYGSTLSNLQLAKLITYVKWPSGNEIPVESLDDAKQEIIDSSSPLNPLNCANFLLKKKLGTITQAKFKELLESLDCNRLFEKQASNSLTESELEQLLECQQLLECVITVEDAREIIDNWVEIVAPGTRPPEWNRLADCAELKEKEANGTITEEELQRLLECAIEDFGNSIPNTGLIDSDTGSGESTITPVTSVSLLPPEPTVTGNELIPRFTFVPSEPEIEELITFDASNTTIKTSTGQYPCSTCSYSWDMGDGTTKIGRVIAHRYTAIGSYTVRLTVRSDEDLTGTAVQRVVIATEELSPSPSGSTITEIPYITVTPKNWTAPRDGTVTTRQRRITITASQSTIAWQVTSTAPWITVTPNSGIGSGAIQIEVGIYEGTSSSVPRSAVIRINDQSVTVTQLGTGVNLNNPPGTGVPPVPLPIQDPCARDLSDVYKIQTILNDTELVLESAWEKPPATATDITSFRLSPMGDIFGTFEYTDEYPLGRSGLTLGDMLVNFQSPVFEVPRVNTAMLTFGLGTPLLDADGSEGCPGTPDSLSSVRGEVTGIINQYASSFNLATDEGAGKFVEQVACVAGPKWGLWRKTGGKQYNNHSVELLVYASDRPLINGKYYQFVDIITKQGSSAATADFSPTCEPFGNRAGGESNWFKPNCPSEGGGTPSPGGNAPAGETPVPAPGAGPGEGGGGDNA